jgi:small-conductance mechanosensitive channel
MDALADLTWPAWAPAAIELSAAAVLGLLAHAIATRLISRWASRIDAELAPSLVRPLRPASRLIFLLVALQIVTPTLATLPESVAGLVHHGLALLTIAAGAWLAIAVVGGLTAWLRSNHRVDVEDNLRAREVVTRINVLQRSAVVVIVVIAVAMGLMTFPSVRQIGTTLLASAGIAGLAIGLAARPVLENLIAGLQLALTQPIRIDDVVIVEGEWGRIEEITITYVVVRIWDDRRLVVPISWFINQPFQNWTRRTAELTGVVFLYTDYTVPVDRVREALREIVESEPAWDRRVCVLQVTDATEKGMQLRALVSARDSGDAWTLRVAVREKLIAFLQREYPSSLPRLRVEAAPEAAPAEPPTNGPANAS